MSSILILGQITDISDGSGTLIAGTVQTGNYDLTVSMYSYFKRPAVYEGTAF